MLQRIKIEAKDNELFARCWRLYVEAFPEVERRDMNYHIEAMQHDTFSFEAILDDDNFIGIVGWWQLSDIRFIEHLATTDEVRGQGYGRKILDSFAQESTDKIILEVEHPTTPLSNRRIEFYKRSGYHLNSFEYSHPSYDITSSERVHLLIMSHPQPLGVEEYDRFCELCYNHVHFWYK